MAAVVDDLAFQNSGADLLFLLGKYLGFQPEWVRYAISVKEKPSLPTKLLQPGACQPGTWKKSFAKWGFGQEKSLLQLYPSASSL